MGELSSIRLGDSSDQYFQPTLGTKKLKNSCGKQIPCLAARPDIYIYQGTINCGTSSQADFILNYFLAKFLNLPKISSKVLKFPHISYQIPNFILAQLAG